MTTPRSTMPRQRALRPANALPVVVLVVALALVSSACGSEQAEGDANAAETSSTTDGDHGGLEPSDSTEPVAGEVLLWISNQSFADDPIGITVTIDGVQVIADRFNVDDQHNWIPYLLQDLAPGDHQLVATSDTGVEHRATITVSADEPGWAVLDYWHYPDQAEADGGGRHFSFDQQNEPISFA